MSPRTLLGAALIAAATMVALLWVLIWQPWTADEPSRGDRSDTSGAPSMTLEGVIALVSREHAGCPEQPALVLTAEATYDGDGKWTVTYGDYSWTVNEEDGSVRPIGDPLPCPRR